MSERWKAPAGPSNEGVYHVRDADGHRVAMAYTMEHAQLVAAAPELLEVLLEIQVDALMALACYSEEEQRHGDGARFGRIHDTARAAIGKAMGEG